MALGLLCWLVLVLPLRAQESRPEHAYKIHRSGLYLLDREFRLSMAYPESTADWARYNDVIVFGFFTKRGSLVFDYPTRTAVEVALDRIDSVTFVSGDLLLVSGARFENSTRSYREESATVAFKDRKTEQDQVGKTWTTKEDDELIYWQAYSRRNVDSELSQNKDDDVYIFRLYDRLVRFDLTGIMPRYDFTNIVVFYDRVHGAYFISANNYGRLE